MSQQALAAAVGVHVNTVARWECDGIDPLHHRALLLITTALDCSVEQLTGEAVIAYRADDVGASCLAAISAGASWSEAKSQIVAAYLARFPGSWQG